MAASEKWRVSGINAVLDSDENLTNNRAISLPHVAFLGDPEEWCVEDPAVALAHLVFVSLWGQAVTQ